MREHDVARENLGLWLTELRANYVDQDSHLLAIARRFGRPELVEELRTFGRVAADMDRPIRRTNQEPNLPRLDRYDAIGRRTEQVVFHPDYHAIGRALYATGAMARYAEPGSELDSLAMVYVAAQNGESGHTCPMACTAGMIKILQGGDGTAPPEWLERLLKPDYDEHYHGAQFLTEVQGGADVGTNAALASSAGDGSYRINGEKWFCSVADAHLMLVTARVGSAQGTPGVQSFIVPRHLADGTVNGLQLRRLKDKLGTRSMASAEIDFVDAWAWPVGDFKATVRVVLNTSRLYNAVVSSGMLQRTWREVEAYARHRVAFGVPLRTFPQVAMTLADVRATTYAARGLTFALVHLSDSLTRGSGGPVERGAYRMLVNLNKFWTSDQCTATIRDGIEILGGNGAIEEFSVLPRLLRDSIVCEQWEGPHNVLCQQVLRDCHRLSLHKAMFAWLEGLAGPHPRLERARERWDRVLAMPSAEQARHIRQIATELRPVAQAIALLAEAASPQGDPMAGQVAAWVLARSEPGYDPLDDTDLKQRISALIGR